MAMVSAGTTNSLGMRFSYVHIKLQSPKNILIIPCNQDPDNTFLRPVLFLTDNATDVSVSGIHYLNSPCWNNFFVRTKNIKFDGVRFDAFSNNASVKRAISDRTEGVFANFVLGAPEEHRWLRLVQC